MAYKKNPTAEQKKAWVEQAKKTQKEAFEKIKQIAEGYRNDPEKMMEYVQFASKFYNYSPNNVALIYAQNPNAMFVQSFKSWKDMGASPVKGASGIRILVPVKTTYLEVSEGELVRLSEASKELKDLYKKNQIESIQKLHFSVGCVFDISQTTYPKEKYPELISMGHTSKEHETITHALINFSEQELGCPVEDRDLESVSLRGYYQPTFHRITLNHLLEDTERLSTMSHELGHALIHYDRPNRTTAQKEFEGDALSIMLLQHNHIELEDRRKSHIATHYKQLKKECEVRILTEHENITQEEMEQKIDEMIMESFSNVFSVYRARIDTIDTYIEQELQKGHFEERSLDKMIYNELLLNTFLGEQRSLQLNRDKIRLLEKNGVNPDFIKKCEAEGSLSCYGTMACIYQNEQGRLIVPFNSFVVPEGMDVRNMYQEGEQESLFVTGNRIEYLAHLSNHSDVLLIEKEDLQDIDKMIHKQYKSICFGNGLNTNYSNVLEQFKVTESAPTMKSGFVGIEL